MDPRDEPFSAQRIDEQIERLLEQATPPAPPSTTSTRLMRQLRRFYRQQAAAERERTLARAWQRITQEAAQRSAAASDQPQQRIVFPPVDLEALRQAARQSTPTEHQTEAMFSAHKGASIMHTKRARGLAALITLAVVVALFAFLFSTVLPRHTTRPPLGSSGTPQATVSAAATPIALPAGQWTVASSLDTFSGDIPVIMLAPENPNILYASATPSGTSSTLILRRSDDGGKTWHSLPSPTGLPADFDSASIAVSPLDVNVVLVTLTIYESVHPGACQLASTGSSNALARFSGGTSCGAQFYSADGGQHWSRLRLPVAGELGATSVNVTAPTSEEVFRPQGQRLYSAVNASTTLNVTFGGPGARILASDDGGATWKLVDAELHASGQNTCDYLPTPTGSTIFALTQADACYDPNDATPSQFLWRSDDAGAHWTQVSKLSGLAAKLTLTTAQSGAAPTLYLTRYPASLPAPNPKPTPSAETTQGDADLWYSQDGGQTWEKAPASGLAGPGNTGPTPNTATGPIATLSDGSVVASFPTRDRAFIFAAWKPGEHTWRPIAPALAHVSMLDSFQITAGAQGTTTFWVIALNADNTSHVLRYDQH